jgi:hypothetical protein
MDAELMARRARILDAITSLGSQKAFAEATGLDESRISRALNPDMITNRRLIPLERAITRLKAPTPPIVKAIASREKAIVDNPRPKTSSSVPLVRLIFQGPENTPRFEDVAPGYLRLPPDLLGPEPDSHGRLGVMHVSGHGMEPTASPGDYLLIRHSARETLEEDVLYLFHAPSDALLVRRLRWTGEGDWLLQGDHPSLPPIRLSPAQRSEWRPLGRVLWILRRP